MINKRHNQKLLLKWNRRAMDFKSTFEEWFEIFGKQKFKKIKNNKYSVRYEHQVHKLANIDELVKLIEEVSYV